jgi:hypothetical protein
VCLLLMTEDFTAMTRLPFLNLIDKYSPPQIFWYMVA